MPKILLTDTSVRSLKVPSEGQITYFDKNLAGFNVRVSQGGTKTYTVVYGATRRRITIGRVGIISLADARKEARRVLAEHTLGKVRPEAVTFQDALDEFLEESSRHNKPRTTKDYTRLLNAHFKLGRTPLTEVTQREIKQRLTKLNDVPSEKHHAYVAIRRFMKWSVANQYIPYSPVEGVKVALPRAREIILPPEKLKIALRASLTQKTMFHSIVALLILTGQRRGEIVSLKWDWVEKDRVTLPDTKNGRSHTFPLSKKAQAVVKNIPRTSEYVFPSRVKTGTTFNGWGKSKEAFNKEIGFSDYTLHDLRRSFASTLASLEVPIHVTEKLLNHVSGTHGGIVGVYQRYSYWDEMCEAVKVYEKYLQG